MRVTNLRAPGVRHTARSGPPPLLLVYAVTVTGILNNTLIGPAIPDILSSFGQPDSRAGLLVASGALPGIVVAPLIGVLADRFGRRRVLTPCLVIFGIGGGLAALAPSFALLLALRLVQGVGGAGLINLAVVIIGDHWTGGERARLVGRNAATLTISLAVFPALGGLLTELGGWRLAFAPYPLALVTALLVWRLLPDVELHPQPELSRQLRDAAGVLRQPLLTRATLAAFGVFFLIFGLYLTVLPVLLEDRFGLSAGARGLVLAAPALSSTAAALLVGRLRARFGGRVLVLAGSVCFAVAFTTIGLAPALGVLLLGGLFYGLGEGVSIPTYQDFVAGSAPAASRGAVVAVWVGAARAGQVAGPLAAGAALAALAPGGVFVVGGGLAVATLVAQLRTDPSLRPAPPADPS
ncbi:MAG: MFS transporter [Acidimicrobiales bacterium]|nr:MFS transporter [Acidimicrobiales bacterium]MCB9372486.1 MFS transporter [Microthrixaceae bacterium]